MRKLFGAAVIAVMGFGVPVGAWAVGRQVTQAPATQSGQSSQRAGQDAQASGMTSIDQRELDYLHQRIGQLEQRNAQLQAEVDRGRRPMESGVGGSGPTDSRASGELVGTVQAVSPQRISVVDSFGTRFDLGIAANTEASSKGKAMALDKIREGQPVRVRFDVVNNATVARRFEVLPKDALKAPRAQPRQTPPARR